VRVVVGMAAGETGEDELMEIRELLKSLLSGISLIWVILRRGVDGTKWGVYTVIAEKKSAFLRSFKSV